MVNVISRACWKVCAFWLMAYSACALAQNSLPEITTQKLSALSVTPGQIVTLEMVIRYPESMALAFIPNSQQWTDLRFIDHQLSLPRWTNQSWWQTLSLRFYPVRTGDITVPSQTFNLFEDQQFLQIHSEPVVLAVRSNFAESITQIQPVHAMPELSDHSSQYLLYLISIFAVGLAAATMVIRRRNARITCCASPSSQVQCITPIDLADQAVQCGELNWEELRLWLQTTIGKDPLAPLPDDEHLLQQYQSLRFRSQVTVAQFVDYCHRCQERWG